MFYDILQVFDSSSYSKLITLLRHVQLFRLYYRHAVVDIIGIHAEFKVMQYFGTELPILLGRSKTLYLGFVLTTYQLVTSITEIGN